MNLTGENRTSVTSNTSALLHRFEKSQLLPPLLAQGERRFKADAILLIAVDYAAFRSQPDPDVRRQTKMRHQDERAVLGRDEAIPPFWYLDPSAALGMGVDCLDHPSLRQVGRHRNLRQCSAK